MENRKQKFDNFYIVEKLFLFYKQISKTMSSKKMILTLTLVLCVLTSELLNQGYLEDILDKQIRYIGGGDKSQLLGIQVDKQDEANKLLFFEYESGMQATVHICPPEEEIKIVSVKRNGRELTLYNNEEEEEAWGQEVILELDRVLKKLGEIKNGYFFSEYRVDGKYIYLSYKYRGIRITFTFVYNGSDFDLVDKVKQEKNTRSVGRKKEVNTVERTVQVIHNEYQNIDAESDEGAQQAIQFLHETFTDMFESCVLARAAQASWGYKFVFELQLAHPLEYTVDVKRTREGSYQITDAHYLALNQPNLEQFQEVSEEELHNSAYLGSIFLKLENLVQLPSEILSVSIFKNQPYYLLNINNVMSVIVLYDYFLDEVIVQKTIVEKQPVIADQTGFLPPESEGVEEREEDEEEPIVVGESESVRLVPVSDEEQDDEVIELVDTPVSIEDLLFERESEFSEEDFLELNVNNEELVNLASTAVNSLFETVSSLDPQFDVLSVQYALSYTTLEFLFIFDTGEGQLIELYRYDLNGQPEIYNMLKATSEEESRKQTTQPIEQIPQKQSQIEHVTEQKKEEIEQGELLQQHTTQKITQSQILTTEGEQTRTEQQEEIITSEEEQKSLYNLNINNIKLHDLASVSDPNLIAILTQSKAESINMELLEKIVGLIVQKFEIESTVSIVLINEIEYGMRLVLEIEQDRNIFEAVVEVSQQEMEIIHWRKVNSLKSITSAVFDRFYPVQPDPEIQQLLPSLFSSNTQLTKISSIISLEKKLAVDGIYYRVILETVSGNQYQIILYYLPDTQYHEVISYQLVTQAYDASKEEAVTQDLQAEWEGVEAFLNSKFEQVIKGLEVRYMATYAGEGRFWRVVFEGANGRYEVIVRVLEGASETIRWERVENGYVVGEDKSKEVREFADQYIKEHYNIEGTYDVFKYRSIPSGGFYQLFYTKPFPFMVYLSQSPSLHFIGLQSIPILPVSPYYCSLFRSYNQINLNTLDYDDKYTQFLFLLQQHYPLIRDEKYEVLAAFVKEVAGGVVYRVLYNLHDDGGEMWLGEFRFDGVSGKYWVEEFERIDVLPEEESYKWKCRENGIQTGICEQCEDGYMLTKGRCYKEIKGCEIQVGGCCQACSPGQVLTRRICLSSPSAAVQQTLESLQTKESIEKTPDNTLPAVIVGDYSTYNDMNCRGFSGQFCVKCAYRFYLKEGVCTMVSDGCSRYDFKTGQCFSCYTGYQLWGGKCEARDPLCARYDDDGQCIRCVHPYFLHPADHRCHYRAPSQRQRADPLCLFWQGSQCVECVEGSYLNPYSHICTLDDPNCVRWDKFTSQCIRCRRGLAPINGICQ